LCGPFNPPLTRSVFRHDERSTVCPNFLSCGFPKIAPPLTYTSRVRSQSPPEREFLRPCAAKHRTPSAHVVPPDFGGLLRELLYRFVAPCSQPWGSSPFQCSLPPRVFPHWLVLRTFLRLVPHTLRSFSLAGSRAASPQSLPSRRCSDPLFPASRSSTSRLCSTIESVADCRCFHPQPARCSLGLGSPSRRSPRSDCPSGQLRSFTAVAALLWATSTEVAVPWTLPSPKRHLSCRSNSVPASGIRRYRLRRVGCEHPTRRPADRSQPAIELSEPASHTLYSFQLPIP